MTPEHGGKIELKLGIVTAEVAEYAAELQTADDSWLGTARVPIGQGPIELGPWSSMAEPPPWLLEDARAALRAALRTSQAEGHWPRRITRWRPEPSG